jgi:hypothetical protein
MAEQTFCTPYFSRTIKGWKIRVKICFGVDSTAYLALTYSGLTSTIATDLTALTNSSWVAGGGWSQQVDQVWATATSDYDNAEDVAVFTFATTDGTLGKISVPNPKDSIFLADKMTIDPSNSAVTNFVASLNLGGSTLSGFVASTAGGALYNTFIGGLRVRKRTRRKLNIWVRNPELTAPGI